MVLIILVVGAVGSILISSWLIVVAALVLSVALQESVLYDLHRHIIHLEDKIDGTNNHI